MWWSSSHRRRFLALAAILCGIIGVLLALPWTMMRVARLRLRHDYRAGVSRVKAAVDPAKLHSWATDFLLLHRTDWDDHHEVNTTNLPPGMASLFPHYPKVGVMPDSQSVYISWGRGYPMIIVGAKPGGRLENWTNDIYFLEPID